MQHVRFSEGCVKTHTLGRRCNSPRPSHYSLFSALHSFDASSQMHITDARTIVSNSHFGEPWPLLIRIRRRRSMLELEAATLKKKSNRDICCSNVGWVWLDSVTTAGVTMRARAGDALAGLGRGEDARSEERQSQLLERMIVIFFSISLHSSVVGTFFHILRMRSSHFLLHFATAPREAPVGPGGYRYHMPTPRSLSDATVKWMEAARNSG